MKLTKDTVKAAIALELNKQGHTLEDFEAALKANDNVKIANWLEAGGDAMKILGATAALGGGALGMGAYGMYAGNDDSNDKLKKKLVEQRQYEEALRDLKAAQKLQQGHSGF